MLNPNSSKMDSVSSKYRRDSYEPQQRTSPNTQSYRRSFKQNLAEADWSPSFRRRDAAADPGKMPEDIHTRLQQIRKKYENQLGSIRQHDRSISPLKELNMAPTPRLTELKLSESKPTIQRTFSFINVESTESKPETGRVQEESFVEPNLDLGRGLLGWRNTHDYPEASSKIPPNHPTSFENFKSFEGRDKQTKVPEARDSQNKSDLYISNKYYERENKSRRSVSQTKSPLDNVTDFNARIKATSNGVHGQKVESIDRINGRIKEILQSIRENDDEAYLESYRKNQGCKSRVPEEDYSPLKPEIKMSARGNASSIHSKSVNVEIESYTKKSMQPIIQQKTQSSFYQSKQSKPISLSIKYTPKRNNYSDSKPKEIGSYDCPERPHTFRTPVSDQKGSGFTPKSIPKPEKISEKRDLDLQIQKIQQKMKRTQEQKRKLWMNEVCNKQIGKTSQIASDQEKYRLSANKLWTPESWQTNFSHKPTTKYPNLQDYNPAKSTTPSRKSSHQTSVRDFTNITNQSQTIGIERQQHQEKYKQATKYQQKQENYHDHHSEFKNRQTKIEYRQEYTPNVSIPQAQQLSIKILPVQCQSDSEVKLGKETKKLIDCLKHQASLDEQFRNAKIWLDSADIYSKWQTIGQVLQQRGINMPTSSIEQQFTNTLQEHNPFFTIKNYNETPSTVVDKYLSARSYWQQHILGKFDTEQLKRECFNESRLDLQRKGFLTVQDLVRFLNIETGTFYRNRDLILIFRRITNQEQVAFQDLMRKLGF